MASVRLQPPSSFDFKNPDEWPKWKRRFQQFHLASGLSEDGEEKQVSTLMYCMGEDAEDTLASTNISEEDRKQYETVIRKFDAFFKVRKNVIFKRARFIDVSSDKMSQPSSSSRVSTVWPRIAHMAT